jgi:hypothetical protein
MLVICSIFPRNIARSIKGFSAFFRLFADGVVADWKSEMIGVGNVPLREEILKPIEVIRKPNRVLGQGRWGISSGKMKRGLTLLRTYHQMHIC